ncbi:MAG TPA: hypothetical protein VNE58_00445 [Casimicrobiaceae bacterium]|nr:hypothetical protein [Casimicrobiaceae bacterium]
MTNCLWGAFGALTPITGLSARAVPSIPTRMLKGERKRFVTIARNPYQ